MLEDTELVNCLLNFPAVDPERPFVLDCRTIAEAQKDDLVLQQFAQHLPKECKLKDLGKGLSIVAYHQKGSDRPLICIPDAMIDAMVSFYHQVLGHPGVIRLEGSLRQHFHHRFLHDKVVERVKHCNPCQKCKNVRTSCGELPERQAHMIPWSDLAVDLIGPWVMRDKHGNDHTFRALLTMIDMVTNCVDIIRLDNKTAENVARQFENHWLARYPRPNSATFDPGTEFKGAFRDPLTSVEYLQPPQRLRTLKQIPFASAYTKQ